MDTHHITPGCDLAVDEVRHLKPNAHVLVELNGKDQNHGRAWKVTHNNSTTIGLENNHQRIELNIHDHISSHPCVLLNEDNVIILKHVGGITKEIPSKSFELAYIKSKPVLAIIRAIKGFIQSLPEGWNCGKKDHDKSIGLARFIIRSGVPHNKVTLFQWAEEEAILQRLNQSDIDSIVDAIAHVEQWMDEGSCKGGSHLKVKQG